MYELTISDLTIKFNFPTDKLEQEIDSIIILASMFGYKYESFSNFQSMLDIGAEKKVVMQPSVGIVLKQQGKLGKFLSIWAHTFDENCEFRVFSISANDHKGKKILVKVKKEEDIFKVLQQLKEFI